MNEITYKLNYGKVDFTDSKMIRQTVFVNEQGFENEFDDIDDYAYHLVLYLDNHPVATARMYCKDQATMILGRIAVLKKYRKYGLGTKLVQRLEKEAQKLKFSTVKLSAQQQAMSFYQKLGYKSFGDIYYDEWCPHITMVKNI